MLGELKHPRGLPTTIIVKQSSFVVFFSGFHLFIFLLYCFIWKSKRLEWWSSMNQMYRPLHCSLPLEIIPVYFVNGSQKLCCHPLPQFRLFVGKLHADFPVPMNTKWGARRGTLLFSLFSFQLPFIFSLAVSSSVSPSALIWCDAHTISVVRPELTLTVSQTLACEPYNCNRD